jgi:hypothetical protein
MDSKLFWFGTLLFVVGFIIFLFAGRFVKWGTVIVIKNRLILFTRDERELTEEEIKNRYFKKWPRRGLWLLWLSGIRILAAMAALVGVITIIESIVDY